MCSRVFSREQSCILQYCHVSPEFPDSDRSSSDRDCYSRLNTDRTGPFKCGLNLYYVSRGDFTFAMGIAAARLRARSPGFYSFCPFCLLSQFFFGKVCFPGIPHGRVGLVQGKFHIWRLRFYLRLLRETQLREVRFREPQEQTHQQGIKTKTNKKEKHKKLENQRCVKVRDSPVTCLRTNLLNKQVSSRSHVHCSSGDFHAHLERGWVTTDAVEHMERTWTPSSEEHRRDLAISGTLVCF